MSLFNVKISAAVKKKCAFLDEKIKFLDYAKVHSKMVCHAVAEKFNSGKTAAADILKNAKKLRTDYGFFQGNLQK